MTINDPIGDMITRIRNAQARGKLLVRSPASSLRAGVLDVLSEEGYIDGYISSQDKNGHSEFEISLKYRDAQPVIREIRRVSKPGRRVYVPVRRMPIFRNGLGISILSTSMGVMSNTAAREKNVGGEVLCSVF